MDLWRVALGWLGAERKWGGILESYTVAVCFVRPEEGLGWMGYHHSSPNTTLSTCISGGYDLDIINPWRNIVLTPQVDPVVYNMLHENPGNISYSAVGGLSDQIRELRESTELPLMNPELFLRVGIKPPKVNSRNKYALKCNIMQLSQIDDSAFT